jgi:hypothetical protein
MTNEELLKRMTFKEVSDIKHELTDELEMCLFKNGFGIRIARVQLKGEKLNINQIYDVEFHLTFMNLVDLDTDAMKRLSKVLTEMSAELEKVNNEYKGYTFVF